MAWLDGVGYCTDAELAAYDAVVAETEIEDAQAGWDHAWTMLADAERDRAADQQRQAEDAAEAQRSRRGTDEARLARALPRIGRGSYVAGREAALERDGLSVLGMVTGSHTCGPSIEGYCMNSSSHSAECGALSTSEIGQGLADAGVYRQIADRGVLDAVGSPVQLPGGEPARWSDVVESVSGQRTRTLAFEDGGPRPELARIGTENPYADLADEHLVQRARAGMNIGDKRTGHERGAEAQTRAAVAQIAGWKSGRIPHADFGESTRERADRLHRPAQLQPVDEPVNGSLGTYRAG